LPHPEQLLFTKASENDLTHLKGIAPYLKNNVPPPGFAIRGLRISGIEFR